MRLRYQYRTYPNASQRRALAQAFGCARVVWNDCLRDRMEAHASGLPYVTSAELSRLRITQAKQGVKDGPKPLHVREWMCKACGTVHDRDHNAAKNTLAAGRADRLNASWSAGKTRTTVPAQRGEAGSHPDGRTTVAGIPAV
jgi:transposase